MKRGGRNPLNTLLIFAIIITLSALIFIILKGFNPTTRVIEKPYTPENCSNESIKKAWEGIFKGSSQNLTILQPPQNIDNQTNDSYELIPDIQLNQELFMFGGCPVYSVYQANGTSLKMLVGVDTWFFIDMKMVYAINARFKPGAVENITAALNNYSEVYSELLSIILMGLGEEGENTLLQPRGTYTSQQAEERFEYAFKITSSNWTIDPDIEGLNLTVYSFNESEEMQNITLFGESINPSGEISKVGMVFGNYSLDTYTYAEMSTLGILDKITKEFENWTSPINTSLKNITIIVNESKLDIFEEYQDPQKVKIIQNNNTIIETEVNFTERFDWTKIILKKQEANSTRGYIIINGLNSTKNITLDRLNNKSDSVCIKDKEIDSIEEISQNCNSSYEYHINCTPYEVYSQNITINTSNIINNLSNFTCTVYEDRFIITGLAHSAIIEMLPFIEEEKLCIQNWACSDWTDIEDECGYRTCTDINNCNNMSGIPLEEKACPICIPDWNCTAFLPEKCPKSEKRTRICTDVNNCQTNEGEPETTQNCERKNNLIWIALGIGGGIIILLLILIFTMMKKGKIERIKTVPAESKKMEPSLQNYPHKEHPHYPSNKEQADASKQTEIFKSNLKPHENEKEEYYYSDIPKTKEEY